MNAKEAAAKATIDTVVAAAVGSCAKSLRGNASSTGFACCMCSKKFKEAPHLKNHLKTGGCLLYTGRFRWGLYRPGSSSPES